MLNSLTFNLNISVQQGKRYTISWSEWIENYNLHSTSTRGHIICKYTDKIPLGQNPPRTKSPRKIPSRKNHPDKIPPFPSDERSSGPKVPPVIRGRMSPDRWVKSPNRGRMSPDRWVKSPNRGRMSTDRWVKSPKRGRMSPDRWVKSPNRRRMSPDRWVKSPNRGRMSPDPPSDRWVKICKENTRKILP